MHINCHTWFSLKYGTLSPKALLAEAKKKRIKTLAITDINNTSALLELLRQSENTGIKIIAGIDFRNGAQQQFIGLAKNNSGFHELNTYLSEHQKNDFPSRAPAFRDAFIIYPYGLKKPDELQENEFVGIRVSQVNKLLFTEWKHHQEKLVILHPVTFRSKRDFNAHRLLRAIDNNALLSRLPKSEEAAPEEIMLPENKLKKKFDSYPALISNTENLLKACSIRFEFGEEKGHNNLRTYTGNKDLDFRLMKRICYQQLSYRYDHITTAILDRIEMELNIIRQKEFISYFLIAWKITKYARQKGYFYVGRGSGANSIIAYLMRITDVDPIELDLYFERFINLFRKTPPDFDIDFSWKDREDITRFIFERFPNTALLAAYSTFQYKSVIRELSKVFGLPDHEIKKLQNAPYGADDMGQLILKYSKLLHGFPSHLTVHSAGIIISEKPVHHYSATFMPPKGFPTTHFDMHIAEDIALYKFDILGQRGLAKVKDALAIIRQNRNGKPVDIHNMQKLKKDGPSNDLLKNGTAIGCFYVESPAMRMLLRKLKVADYAGLVAASSVIRPGVAQSGMMREYILRHRSMERRLWAKNRFPKLYELMPETYGVMVYQEDVIKVAHYFAGLSLAEADILRRGMSGKFRSREEFQEVKEKFFSNCRERKISDADTFDIWNQIESFAGYAFAKGHSASYAVESYQCLYLKAYYPLEFLIATINNGGGFYSPQLYLHEARKHDATVHLPCVNRSDALTNLKGKDIYLGLDMIYSLEAETVQTLLCERQRNSFFKDLSDFINRMGADISLEQLILMIRSDSFRFSKKNKKELLWEAHLLINKKKRIRPAPSLFETKPKHFDLPELWKHELEDAFDEIELFGFLVTVSPFKLAGKIPESTMIATKFPYYVNKIITITGYLVHIKSTRTKDGRKMYFGTFIDMEGEWIDTVIFPPVAARHPFSGPGCYLLHGKITEEFGFHSLEIIGQKRIPGRSLDDTSIISLPENR